MVKEYIERDKVLSHKWEVRSYDPSDPDPVTEVVSVSSIMCIPAANVVERKKGMWECNKNNGLLYCPFCDSVAPAEDQHGEMIFRPPFCHQCGSDLREGKDG